MKHRNSAELLGCWDKARGHASIPDRNAIKPEDMARILPFVFLVEELEGSALFRLAGTAVCAAHGSELRGTMFRNLWADQDRRQIDVLMQQMAEDGIGTLLCSDASNEHETVRFETLLLPLGQRKGDRLLIGVQSALGQHWSLRASKVSGHSLVTMRTLVQGRTSPGALRAAGLDAGDEVSFIDFSRRGRIPQGMHVRRVRHLSVIEGGA